MSSWQGIVILHPVTVPNYISGNTETIVELLAREFSSSQIDVVEMSDNIFDLHTTFGIKVKMFA